MAISLDAELRAITLEFWNRKQRPILLSLLGERLTVEAQEQRRLAAATLADYISGSMQDSLRTVLVPGHGTGAVPVPEADGVSDKVLASSVPPPKVVETVPPGTSTHVVHKDIWVLFRYGLHVGERAYVEVPVAGPAIVHRLTGDNDAEARHVHQ